jgi:integrase
VRHWIELLAVICYSAGLPKLNPNEVQILAAINLCERAVYSISKHPGLHLATSFETIGDEKVGRGSWRIKYRPRGAKHQPWLTLSNDARGIKFKDLAERARTIFAELRVEGVDPKEKIEEEIAAAKAEQYQPEAMTLDALFIDWLERHSKVKKRTWHHDESVYRAQFKCRLGDKLAAEITRKEIIGALGEISAEIGGLQVNRAHTLISSMYTWAVSMELVEKHPATKIPKFAVETERTRIWTSEELRKLWRALGAIIDGTAKGPISPTLARVLQMLDLTGQRRGEVGGAAAAEIDGDVWTIPANRMKAKKPHTIPLPPMALGIVRDALAASCGTRQVFPGKGGAPMDPHSVTRALSRLAASIGIEGATVHDIRRTVASELGRLGGDESVISRVLAHTQSGITARVYNQHAYIEEKRRALRLWQQRVVNISSGRRLHAIRWR